MLVTAYAHRAISSRPRQDWQHAIGASNWDWAGSMMFQRVIGEHGTIEEKRGLATMKVGFTLSEDRKP